MKPGKQIEFDFSAKPEPEPDVQSACKDEAADQGGEVETDKVSSLVRDPDEGVATELGVEVEKIDESGASPTAVLKMRTEQPEAGRAMTGRDPPAALPGFGEALPMPPPPVLLSAPAPLGIRMVNEYVYCPRLFYYETVESVFVHNRDTLEGGEAHKRVDTAKPGKLPAAKTGGKTKGKSKAESGTPEVTAGGSMVSGRDKGGTSSLSDTHSETVPDSGADSVPDSGTASGSDDDPEEVASIESDSAAGTSPSGASAAAVVPQGEAVESIHARSVELSSPSMNLTAKLDLVEGLSCSASGGVMVYTPVEYKKGRPREGDDGRELWDADRVQLMLQILLLRENGFPSEEGVVYYRETRQRVTFRPTPEDADWARRMAAGAHAAKGAPMPPPLDHSPKCPRCSLVGICLPDETRMMSPAVENPGFLHAAAPMAQLDLGLGDEGMPPAHPPSRNALIDYVLRMPAPGIRRVKVDPDLRRLIAPNPETRALYLNTPGAWVGKSGETVTVKEKDSLIGQFLLKDLHHVALFGPVQVSTAVIQALCEAEIPLTYFSTGGWFYGITRGHTLKNVLTRIEQFRAAADPVASLALARRMIHGKIVNQRTLLMRNHLEPPKDVLHGMKYFAQAALMAIGLPQLLGVEGNAAALYFGALGGMLKPKTAPSGAESVPPEPQAEAEDRLTDHHNTAGRPGNAPPLFPFYSDSRNRRPPRDPVNALLSLTYSLLAKECTLACYTVGLDPYVGVLHQPRHGRPALALDIMEEFRPLLADSTVITLINNGMLTERDFVISSHAAGLTPGGRRTVLNAWERRLADPITHPLFGYKVSYRRAIELQTRLLAKSLTGEIAEYIPFMTR